MSSSACADIKLYTCLECKKEFPLDLDPQVLEIFGGSPLCYACSKERLPAYSTHQLSVIYKDDLYVCDICKKCFSGEVDFNSPPVTHTVDEVLNFNYEAYLQDLKMLLQKFIGKNCLCGKCQKIFPCESDLKKHSCSLSRTDSFICETCEKAFSCHSELEKHSCNPAEEKSCLPALAKRVCETCRKTFSCLAELKRRALTKKKKRRQPLADESFIGETDDEVSSRQTSEPKKHSGTHQKEMSLTCKRCQRAFSYRSELAKHSCARTRKSCDCETCGKKFSKYSQLKIHIRTHTGEKPFVCDVCEKAFSHKCHMKRHYLTHTGEKPYVCVSCQKGFADTFSLRMHVLRCHTNERPHVCHCGRAFASAPELRFHGATHTTEKPHVCGICQRAFSLRTYLRLHQKRLHESRASTHLDKEGLR